MTCVAHNSVVETMGVDNEIVLTSVQSICVGDRMRDPSSLSYATIVAIVRQETGGIWPMFHYLGVTADAAQWVHDASQGWVLISDVGTPSICACPTLYSIVLSDGKSIRIGGVMCCTHDGYEPASSVELE